MGVYPHGMNNELIDLLRTVATGFQARMQEQVATDGSNLTTFQARLINLIGRNEGISQLLLGSLTERDKAQVARAVKELEARRLVTRTAHPSDWRTKCLVLTAEGRRIHACLSGLRQRLANEVLSGLSDEEKHAFRASLEKIDMALRSMNPNENGPIEGA